MRRLIASFGISLQALFIIATGLLLWQHTMQPAESRDWPGGFSRAALALELPISSRAVQQTFQLLGDEGIKRQHQALIVDSYGFIPTYWLVIGLLGWLLMMRSIRLAKTAGLLVIALITMAAAFDYRENTGISQTLNRISGRPFAASSRRHADCLTCQMVYDVQLYSPPVITLFSGASLAHQHRHIFSHRSRNRLRVTNFRDRVLHEDFSKRVLDFTRPISEILPLFNGRVVKPWIGYTIDQDYLQRS